MMPQTGSKFCTEFLLEGISYLPIDWTDDCEGGDELCFVLGLFFDEALFGTRFHGLTAGYPAVIR
jgi:hypothetical protein